ncbi:hypothetical protein I308_101459 [Cryptococcus tetragattii IND107]|uniref:Uncharacterized protein n=1 Tax=Cryptococcus tetragattii IND107 TaxID=1296105 RepID=A0ABR3C0B4_9TREE
MNDNNASRVKVHSSSLPSAVKHPRLACLMCISKVNHDYSESRADEDTARTTLTTISIILDTFTFLPTNVLA